MPDSANTVIGHVVDVQGNLLMATLVEDDQGYAPTVTIGDEDVLVGQLGSYVAVKQNEVHLIAIVTRMTEQEALAAPTIETPGDDTARLPFAKRIARLTPVGSIIGDGQFERGVTQYPTRRVRRSTRLAQQTSQGCSTAFSPRVSRSEISPPTPRSKFVWIPRTCLDGTLPSWGRPDRASRGR